MPDAINDFTIVADIQPDDQLVTRIEACCVTIMEYLYLILGLCPPDFFKCPSY